MKNITLSADERLIEKARREAARRGKSLNQMIRDYLEELGGQRSASNEFDRLRELSSAGARCRRHSCRDRSTPAK
ncbi:MAG: MerR family transcriptional regulator [Gammaproteobacteria bacterium HGW-Gammaproteobacteria-8]|nr:MAG: MerR family transcriptional regulator [Gammaproteobacteria bacterium HGW-Gammaproteobacteria-8]